MDSSCSLRVAMMLVMLLEAEPRVTICVKQQAYEVVQPPMEGCESATDPDYLELLKMEFEDVDDTIYCEARAAAELMSLEFHEGPHKKDNRAMEKARLAYQGRYDLLKDLRRASIVCPNIAAVCALVEYVADISKSGLQVVRIKNRFDRKYDANKESAGYRDLQFNVLVPNTQLIWELQVHLKDIEALKTKLRDQADGTGRTGHQRYVAFRTIMERIKDKEGHGSETSSTLSDTHASAAGGESNRAAEAPKISIQQQQQQMQQQQMQQMGQMEKEQQQKMEQLERALEEERSRAKAAERRAEQEAANAKMASEAKKAAEAEKKRAEQEAAEARNAAAKAEEASAKQEAATTAAGTNAMLLAPSEARKAARAALGAQERSKLDKELYDYINDSSKRDPGKVQGMLDRGADPNGYKVRRKQAMQ